MYIGKHLQQYAYTEPDKIALSTEDKKITYKQLYNNVFQIKGALLHTSKKKHIKVGLYIQNNIDFLQTYFAVISLGWIAVPLDCKQQRNTLEQFIRIVDPAFIITDLNQCHLARDVPILHVKHLLYAQFDDENRIDNDIPNDQNHFYIGQTSGSTSEPKVFVRTHASWLKSFELMEKIFPIDDTKKICAPGPIVHSLSLCAATYAIHRGATFYTAQQFSASLLYKQIKHQQIDIIFLIPTMLYALSSMPATQAPVCFICGGDTLPTLLRQNVISTYENGNIYEYYGASELSFITYKEPSLQCKYPDITGKAFPTVEITICNDQGDQVKRNEIGAIYIRSPLSFEHYMSNHHIKSNHYGITVGDLGFLNEQGHLTIVGREKNMIISGGHNVYPEEIEKVLRTNKLVIDAIVLGIPHTQFGEIVLACVKVDKEEPQFIQKLKKLCKQYLPRYKRPVKYIIVDKFPKTANGKIARSILIQQIKGEMKH